MSSFISNEEELSISIMEETNKLNKCIQEWYEKFLEPNDLSDFKGCCDKDEINLLIRCYNIFSENNNLQSLDKDVVKALVAYYYIIQVLENNITGFIDEKYLRIVKEEPSKVPNNKIFTDNAMNIYAYYWNKYDDEEKYIEVHDTVDNIRY
jgi:hypothetical protein